MVKQYQHRSINIAKDSVITASAVCFILLKAPPCKHGRCAGFAVQGTWVHLPQKHPNDWEKEQVKEGKNM